MVNPVGKVAVFAGLTAVGLHKAYSDLTRERERKAAEVEAKRNRAARQDFHEEMARASEASAAERRAQQARSDHDAESFRELVDLRVSLMGRALGDLRRALNEDFMRQSPPLSTVGLPLIGRADSVEFAIAAVLLAWGDDEMLERFWPRRKRRGKEGGGSEEDDEGEGVDPVEAFRVGFCVQRCSPQTLKVVRSWLKNMAEFGPVGEWTVPLPNRAEAEATYGQDSALFGLPSGPPRFDCGGGGDRSSVDDPDLMLDRVALRTFMKGSEYELVKVNIRSLAHFRAVSCLGHIDVVFAEGLGMSANSMDSLGRGGASARYVTRDAVGQWRGPGTYLTTNFPLRKTKPQARSRRQGNPPGRQDGAGFYVKFELQVQPGRAGRRSGSDVRDIQPLTKWLPSEKGWRRASAKEFFTQSMLSREAGLLLKTLTRRTCDGAGLWHFLAISGEPQRYAMSLLGFLEARDVGLLEERGSGKGKEVARVLAAALRKVVPPPAGDTPREAMEALDVEIDTFVHGCYLELLRSLYALPMETLAGRTPADIVDSSIHHNLWDKVLAYVPNQPKLLRVALRSIETEKREAARAASRGGAPAWWTALMTVAVLAAMVLLLVCTSERDLSRSLFFLFGGGRLPAWVSTLVCRLLDLVDPLTAPVVVVTIFEVLVKYCRPPAAPAAEKDGCGNEEQERSSLGAALLWRIEAANEISCNIFRAVALATGLTPPGRRSREELMLKCEEWLRIWGLRQLHSNMASAARRGRITKEAVLQLADGIFLYRAEQQAAAAAAAAGGSDGGGVGDADVSCRGAGTLPGSVEEAEAFLNLPVVGTDDGGDSGEDWVDTPLPSSAVEGALNMAVFGATAEEDETAASSSRLGLGAEGGGGGGDGEDSDDSDDSDDDEDDRPGAEPAEDRRRAMPTEERSYQHPAAAAEDEEAAAATGSRRSSGSDEQENLSDGGEARGMKNTVRRLLARRGWRFKPEAGSMAYYRRPKSAKANGFGPTLAEVRERFVASKTFYHDSVGVGGRWIESVKTMMAIRSAGEALARIMPEKA